MNRMIRRLLFFVHENNECFSPQYVLYMFKIEFPWRVVNVFLIKCFIN